jgi:hypothetical protein
MLQGIKYRDINAQLKSGKWGVLYPDDSTYQMSNLCRLIVDVYDDEVEDLLCLGCTMFSRNIGQAEVKMMGEEAISKNKRI